MFWRVASGSVSSSVEAILSRDSFTLEQLLAEDELVKVVSLQFWRCSPMDLGPEVYFKKTLIPPGIRDGHLRR